jgi:hypothetical protein
MMEKTMKVETMVAFGSASPAVRGRPQAEARRAEAANSRRGHPAPVRESATQDFALAMRRVEAECYDNL